MMIQTYWYTSAVPPAASTPLFSASANCLMWPYMEYCGTVSREKNDPGLRRGTYIDDCDLGSHCDGIQVDGGPIKSIGGVRVARRMRVRRGNNWFARSDGCVRKIYCRKDRRWIRSLAGSG